MRFFLAITTLVWRVAAHPLDHGTDILILEWTFLLRIGLLRPDIDVRRPHGIAWGLSPDVLDELVECASHLARPQSRITHSGRVSRCDLVAVRHAYLHLTYQVGTRRATERCIRRISRDCGFPLRIHTASHRACFLISDQGALRGKRPGQTLTRSHGKGLHNERFCHRARTQYL